MRRDFLRVSCLALAVEAAREHKAETVVSLLSPNIIFPDFSTVPSIRHHHTFSVHDQEAILPEGMVEAVTSLIWLGQSWSDALPQLLVHCHGGISRSTAAAYILLCASQPQISCDTQFENLLRITSKPWPNWRMVKIADELLGKRGAMLAPLEVYRLAYPKRLAVYERLNLRRGLPLGPKR